MDLTGWIWASNTDVQGLFNSLIPREPQAFASPYSVCSDSDVTDFFAAMSGAMFMPTLYQTDEYFTFALMQGFTRDWIYGINGFEGYAPQLNARTPLSEPYEPHASATLSAGVEGHYSTRPFIGGWLYRPYVAGSVPEPGTLALLGLGLAGLGLSRRRGAA